MIKPTLDIMQLAGFGVNIIIDGKTKPTLDILQIVGSVGLKDGHITIRNAQYKPTLDLMQIAKVYPKNITFDFTENSNDK
jgi:hypothetical protein